MSITLHIEQAIATGINLGSMGCLGVQENAVLALETRLIMKKSEFVFEKLSYFSKKVFAYCRISGILLTVESTLIY
jgi:hypothetical protein